MVLNLKRIRRGPCRREGRIRLLDEKSVWEGCWPYNWLFQEEVSGKTRRFSIFLKLLNPLRRSLFPILILGPKCQGENVMIYGETNLSQIVRLPSGEFCRGGSQMETTQRFRSQFGRGDEFEETILFLFLSGSWFLMLILKAFFIID